MRERLPIALVLVLAAVLLTGFHAVDAQRDLLYVVEPDTGDVSQITLPTQGDAQGGQGLTAVPTATPSPVALRAKVEIVWPHEGTGVQDAELANVTAYLLAGDGTGAARSLLDSVPCDWNPTVRLWAAQNNLPARPVALGAKRMVTGGGRRFPAWDFNDVDVSEARDPAKRIAFFVTVDDGARPVKVQHNVWTHAADARTLFPQQDTPTYATRLRPEAVDARIEIVWPKDNLPVQEAKTANVTAYLLNAATLTGVSPDTSWSPVVRLHTSINNEPEAAPGRGVIGTRRIVTGANGVQFLAWDFNDVDVSAANDPLNRIYGAGELDEGQPVAGLLAPAGAHTAPLRQPA